MRISYSFFNSRTAWPILMISDDVLFGFVSTPNIRIPIKMSEKNQEKNYTIKYVFIEISLELRH